MKGEPQPPHLLLLYCPAAPIPSTFIRKIFLVIQSSYKRNASKLRKLRHANSSLLRIARQLPIIIPAKWIKDQETIRITRDNQQENGTYWLCPNKKRGKIKNSKGYEGGKSCGLSKISQRAAKGLLPPSRAWKKIKAHFRVPQK